VDLFYYNYVVMGYDIAKVDSTKRKMLKHLD